jgi:hypothetical protein
MPLDAPCHSRSRRRPWPPRVHSAPTIRTYPCRPRHFNPHRSSSDEPCRDPSMPDRADTPDPSEPTYLPGPCRQPDPVQSVADIPRPSSPHRTDGPFHTWPFRQVNPYRTDDPIPAYPDDPIRSQSAADQPFLAVPSRHTNPARLIPTYRPDPNPHRQACPDLPRRPDPTQVTPTNPASPFRPDLPSLPMPRRLSGPTLAHDDKPVLATAVPTNPRQSWGDIPYHARPDRSDTPRPTRPLGLETREPSPGHPRRRFPLTALIPPTSSFPTDRPRTRVTGCRSVGDR